MKSLLLDDLICAAFLVAGMAGVILPYIKPGVVPGGIVDARLNRFLLEHFFQVVTGNAESFTNPPLFYPWIDTIAFSDTLWGTAPIYSLLRLWGLDPEHAFAGWFAVGFVLNYCSAYAVFRLFGLRSLGSAAGAFLFSFGLPVMAQDSHANLLYRFCVPWAVWALYRYVDTRDVRLLALMGLLIALQLVISFQIGLFLALLLAAYIVVMVVARRPFESMTALRRALTSLLPVVPRGRGPVLTTAALALATVAMLSLVAVPYLQVVYLYHFRREWHEISTMLPRPFSYLMATRSHLWSWIPLPSVPMAHEHHMFFGLVPIVCLGFAFFSRRSKTADCLTLQSLYALGILVVATLNVDGTHYRSLYALLATLPGISAVRAVTRIVLVMIFPAALIMGRVIDLGWAARLQRPYLGAVVVGACLFLVVEASLIRRDTSTIADWHLRLEGLGAEIPALRVISPDSILVVAKARHWKAGEIDAMLLAQSLRVKTMNGKSGNSPPAWAPMKTCADIVGIIQAGERFRQEHGEPGFQIDLARIVPVGFGDCGHVLESN